MGLGEWIRQIENGAVDRHHAMTVPVAALRLANQFQKSLVERLEGGGFECATGNAH